MRLADFILRDMERILAEWEGFAATRLPAAADMNSLGLRDPAQQILEPGARALPTFQGREAQVAKSRGQATTLKAAPETAAHIHAVLRARSAFDINQLASEYRALRGGVLRLWMADWQGAAGTDLEGGIRFNEAIDQALAESISHFSAYVD